MTIVFILLGAAVALELATLAVSKWPRVRTVSASLAAFVGSFGIGVLLVAHLNVFSAIIALLGLYRIFNMLRVVERRIHERYLRQVAVRTSLALLLLQTVLGAGWFVWDKWGSTGHTTWAVIGLVQVAAGLVFLGATLRTLKRTAWPAKHEAYSDAELPTVTVAIPARNETEDLHQCLQSVIASNYPKLEIIVLDDCSQTRRTPEIIRDFAHDGVRFVQGREPDPDWMPKNSAYARLAEESSGSYILFCGVDARFEKHTIRSIISTMLDRKKEMVSIMPRRQPDAYAHFSLIQSMRYWWELAPPRRTFNRPPVLSTCWIIKKDALSRMGGFASASRAVAPEALFARQLVRTDAYSFLRSGKEPGLESGKPITDQRDTAVRVRYPQLHRRPEQVAIVSLLEAAFLILPFVLVVTGFWLPIGWVAHVSALVASLLFSAAYFLIAINTHVNSWWFGWLAQPLAAAVDLALLNYSMAKYEFSTVDWKGRNVCVPAMHVEPRLPKI